jgi:hypothetical protein
MERLRYVARAGGGDPAIIVGETVEAIRGLAPGPRELVSVCRNLVDRNITCGPLWWLCARLLSEPSALARGWDLVDEIAEDPTPDRLVAALPDDATVLTVGNPPLASQALARRGDLTVLAVEAGHAANALIRLLDRNDVESEIVPAEASLAALSRSDLVVLEADACTPDAAICSMGGGLVALAARSTGTPVWLVAGRGRRLPTDFVGAIVRRVSCQDRPWESEYEIVPTDLVDQVIGPDGVAKVSPTALAAECRPVPELGPASTGV